MALALVKEPMHPTRAGEIKQLYCPTCGGELLYDSGMSGLSCENKDRCDFLLSFTESGRGSILWDIRCKSMETDPAKFARLVREVAERLEDGTPLATNPPNDVRMKQSSPEERLERKYRLRPEDIYSIRYSTERPTELARYYGLTVQAIEEIQNTDFEEE